MSLTNREWIKINGFGNKYSISRNGFVRNDKTGRILKASPNMDGYLLVTLFEPGNKKTAYLHQLVSLYFIGACPDGMEVNHKDFDRQNNNSENLEYLTPSENVLHSLGNYERGEKRYNSKIKNSQISEIKVLSKSMSLRAIARIFKVDKNVISRICKEKSYQK